MGTRGTVLPPECGCAAILFFHSPPGARPGAGVCKKRDSQGLRGFSTRLSRYRYRFVSAAHKESHRTKQRQPARLCDITADVGASSDDRPQRMADRSMVHKAFLQHTADIGSRAKARRRSCQPTSCRAAPSGAPTEKRLTHKPASATGTVRKDNVLGYGAELAEDHPGYADVAYKQRRARIARMADLYREGQPVPRLEYLPEEQRCWATVLRELRKLYPTHACKEFLDNLDIFGFGEETVPQLEDVSQTLRRMTGWQIRPVAGLLHPRDFLGGLASKIFHSTQYMRHSSNPMYTPEPDVCHELLGHAVMLANPHYARLAQTIGLASLAAADEKQIWHLTKVYWYTIEFGCVREGSETKAFGAGLLSSFGELRHLSSGAPQLWPFDPFAKQPKMSYRDGFQKGYFVLESFEAGARQLEEYCQAVTPPDLLRQLQH